MPRIKYTKEQRLEIGRQIYTGELSRFDAAKRYNIDLTTARDYMRLYRDVHRLPPKNTRLGRKLSKGGVDLPDTMMDLYSHMSREELLEEIFHLRLTLEDMEKRA